MSAWAPDDSLPEGATNACSGVVADMGVGPLYVGLWLLAPVGGHGCSFESGLPAADLLGAYLFLWNLLGSVAPICDGDETGPSVRVKKSTENV